MVRRSPDGKWERFQGALFEGAPNNWHSVDSIDIHVLGSAPLDDAASSLGGRFESTLEAGGAGLIKVIARCSASTCKASVLLCGFLLHTSSYSPLAPPLSTSWSALHGTGAKRFEIGPRMAQTAVHTTVCPPSGPPGSLPDPCYVLQLEQTAAGARAGIGSLGADGDNDDEVEVLC